MNSKTNLFYERPTTGWLKLQNAGCVNRYYAASVRLVRDI